MKSRALLALFVLTAWVYWPVTTGELVYEDTNDPGLYEPFRGWRAELAPLFAPRPRVLTNVTLRLQRWNDGQTEAFHLGNLAVHLLNALLLCCLLPACWLSVWLVGLWLLHPIQTEAVAYLSSRPDLLAVTCVLLMLLVAKRAKWADLVAASAVGAILAKEAAIVAPLLLALRDGFRRWWWLVAAWGLMGAYVAWSYGGNLHLWTPDSPRGFWSSMALTAYAWCHMVSLIVWPFHRLTIDFDWDLVPVWQTWVALTALSTSLVASWWAQPRLRFALLWMVAAVLPRFLIALPETLHEHQFMTSLLGPVLAYGSAPLLPQGAERDV